MPYCFLLLLLIHVLHTAVFVLRSAQFREENRRNGKIQLKIYRRLQIADSEEQDHEGMLIQVYARMIVNVSVSHIYKRFVHTPHKPKKFAKETSQTEDENELTLTSPHWTGWKILRVYEICTV